MSILPACAVTQASSLPTKGNRQDASVTQLFGALDIYRDHVPHSAAMNMAIDEALLEVVTKASIRFYRWDHPALSFGYFGRLADVTEHCDRDLIRRWTGGGIVLHGEDLTYSIIIPADDPVFAESSETIYERIHRALQAALFATGQHALVAAIGNPRSGISDAGYNCFAHPVRADVMLNGQKIAGAAQRRTRRGLLQQGSIQHVDLAQEFEMRFAQKLANECVARNLNDQILKRADVIAAHKYGTDAWLKKR